jgi:hypothetical protein
MEVRTRGPLDPGKYEALVNYDDPHYPLGYWTKERRSLLPSETLTRLEAIYPAKIKATRKIPGGSKPGRLNLPITEPTAYWWHGRVDYWWRSYYHHSLASNPSFRPRCREQKDVK